MNKTLLVAALAGLAHAAAFSIALGPWLALVALGILMRMLSSPACDRAQRAAAIAFVFGLSSFCAGIGWLFISMHRYGGMPAPIAIAAVVLLSAYLAVFGAMAMALAHWLCRPRHGHSPIQAGIRVLTLGACWTLGELLRAWLFTGFPWLSVGYSQLDGPLANAAASVGVYGLGGLCVALAAALSILLRSRPGRIGAGIFALASAAVPLLAALIAASSLSTITISGEPLRVRLIQGNVGQAMKFDPARALDAMHEYTDALEQGDARLSVLPETAWTVPWDATPPSILQRITARLRQTDGLLAVGMPMPAATAENASAGLLSNTIAVFDGSGRLRGRYDKRHLVPFGEFIPRGFGWFVALMHIPLGEFARGAPHQAALAIDGQSVAFNICYEDLFPSQLRAQVLAGATVLVNASNIGWFGDSHALGQHLAISRMRAIELGRPMLRATNTGMTAAIGADGRVLASLAPLRRGALDVTIQGTRGETVYLRLGDAPVLLACLALVLGAAASRRARARTG